MYKVSYCKVMTSFSIHSMCTDLYLSWIHYLLLLWTSFQCLSVISDRYFSLCVSFFFIVCFVSIWWVYPFSTDYAMILHHCFEYGANKFSTTTFCMCLSHNRNLYVIQWLLIIFDFHLLFCKWFSCLTYCSYFVMSTPFTACYCYLRYRFCFFVEGHMLTIEDNSLFYHCITTMK